MQRKILIVDDEPEFVDALQLRLENSGYTIRSAFDGEAALQIVQECQPDLILLDIMMPKMNGYQVCRKLKNDSETKHIKIAMLTAKTQESDRFWGSECGVDDYIAKPYKSEELLRKIKHLLST